MPATHADFDFFSQNTPHFETWSWIFFHLEFFPIFFFQNTPHFFHLNYISKKKKKKIGETFLSGRGLGRSLPLAFGSRLFWLWGFCQVGGVAVRYRKRLLYSVFPCLSLSPSFTPSPSCPPLSHWPPQLSLPSLLVALDFGTERARLVVQVERLRNTRLRHRTCKTSRSSKKASHPASAQNVQD